MVPIHITIYHVNQNIDWFLSDLALASGQCWTRLFDNMGHCS